MSHIPKMQKIHSQKGTGAKNLAKDPRQLEILENGHPLDLVFVDVIEQVTKGKGQRHGGDSIPFLNQKWLTHANTHGTGFLTGQAAKKLDEAVSSGNMDADPEAWERELLGAIVYIGMAILHNRGV